MHSRECVYPFIRKADYTTMRIQGIPFTWNSNDSSETASNERLAVSDRCARTNKVLDVDRK